MKRFIGLGLTLVLMAVLGGCSQDSSILDPVVGTWDSTGIIGTRMVYNRDDSCVETNTILGAVQYTKTGTWTSNDDSITRTWSDDSSDVLYYSLSSGDDEMTISLSPGGVSTTYERQ
jgi:hypothetical protein